MKIKELNKSGEFYTGVFSQEDSDGETIEFMLTEKNGAKTENDLKKELNRIKKRLLEKTKEEEKQKPEKVKIDKKEIDRIETEINL